MGIHFARVRSAVMNQGKEADKLPQERRSRWISVSLGTILTDEILDDSVQARYFVSRQAAKSGDRHNVDWVSLILGNDKKKTKNKNKMKETLNKRRGENRGKNQKEQKRAKAIAN